ncbi:DNA adenine methylase (plasmid) [Komagataeibacter intermedius]|uniref:DNA adenine methylase n=1 Tax=Komagataeibacter intermedius TaxID=66229 RepID=UPI004036EAAC
MFNNLDGLDFTGNTKAGMQTIQYMGSKAKLVDFIENAMDWYFGNVVHDTNVHTFFDAFSGSGRVAYHFHDRFKVITNDKQTFTKVICDAYMCNQSSPAFYKPFIDALNSIKASDYESLRYEGLVDGFFVDNYSTDYNNGSAVGDDGFNKIWITDNAKIIEIARNLIDCWFDEGKLDDIQKNVLLLTLMLAVNKISNIVGHQNGYLKNWSSNTKKDIMFILPELDTHHTFNHENMTGDVFENGKVSCDIAYFDPPYGTNNVKMSASVRYSSFYHLWNTLVENSRPELFGKTMKPVNTKGYTEPLERNHKEDVIPKFIRLIENTKAKYVMFSYSNKSLLTVDDFRFVFEQAGCDMKTFRLFVKGHTTNSQNVIARKDGNTIERENDEDDLVEYVFMARKKARHIRVTNPNINDARNDNEVIQVIENYLDGDNSTYTVPQAPYVIHDDQIVPVDFVSFTKAA